MTDTYEFFPTCVRNQLPALYSTERQTDPLMICKFFTPDAAWTWYASEFDGTDIFFGYVVGLQRWSERFSPTIYKSWTRCVFGNRLLSQL